MDTDRYSTGISDETSDPLHSEPLHSRTDNENRPAPGHNFGQLLGLHPAVTLLVLVVDTMLFGAQVATLGAILPLAVAAAIVLGVITYRVQMRWYHDDSHNAMTKAFVTFLVTACPSPLPAFVYVPAGLVGLMHTLRGKK